MNAEHENARRHAYNTLAEVNRHMDKGNIKNPQHHQMLTDMAEKATRTLRNLDEMESRRPYSDTNIGYGANTRQRSESYNDTSDAMRAAMDAIGKILPQISDDMDDMEMRRGVLGTGRGRSYGRKRVRVGGYTRRADMDDMDDMDNNAYNNNMRSTSRNDQRMHDAVAAASAAAAATARYMNNDMRGANNIYPSTPVMPRNAYDDSRSDARNAAYNDADARSARNDSETSDRSERPGPGMQR